jgi:putative oxidoreductase
MVFLRTAVVKILNIWFLTKHRSKHLWIKRIGLTIHFDKEYCLLLLTKFLLMKKLLGVGYNASAFNLALFILRVGAGILMVHHGYDKLVHFNQYSAKFMHFLGMNSSFSLALVIFSEFFCSIFVMLGLFTRFACIFLMISTFVAVSEAHGYDILGKGEHASLFFIIYFTILIIGPGRISVDGMINK